MKLSEFGVKWPVTTSMIFIAIVVLGAFSFTRVGIDLMPDLDVPVITVITSYPGAGPAEVESRVTELIESRVSSVENVDEVRSNSTEGVSVVNVKFIWGTNLAEAANDIRDKLGQIRKRLPDSAEEPIIMKIDMGSIPVYVMGVTAEESWDKIDKIIEDKIEDRLKRLPGVASVIVDGSHQRTINVRINRDKLQATGITGKQIVNALRSQNLSNPGGHIKTGSMDFLVRVPEEFSSVKEIEDVVISNKNGIVRIKDVATVEDGFKEVTEDVRINNKKSMVVIVQKQSDGNTVAVSRAVKEALPRIEKDLPKDVKLTEFVDTSNFIVNTINNLENSVIMGGIAVFFVILLFIRDIRASIIVAVTIPTSLVITFLLMYVNGFTINQMSMSSLAIAIGMVVDNAIVVLDNIKRYIDKGVKPRESAIWGTAEMTMSVVASTLTTIAIFLPIVFTTGITKVIFGQLSMIITMALVASLFTSLLLTPMMCSKMLTRKKEEGEVSKSIGSVLESLENSYSKLVSSALNHRRKTIFILIVALISSLAIIPLVGTEYMPKQDQGIMNVEVELPTGTRYEETSRVCDQIVKIINRELKKDAMATFESFGVGENLESMVMNPKKASNFGKIQVKLTSRNDRNESQDDLIMRLRPVIEKEVAGATVRFITTNPIGELVSGGSADLSINLYGHNLEDGMKYATQIKAELDKLPNLKDIEISQKLAKPELQIEVNREKASSLGLNVTDVSDTVELYFSGDSTVKYREGGDEYDIDVRLREEDRVNIADLNRVNIMTPSGKPVRLDNIAKVVEGLGPTKIERYDQERYIKITGQVFNIDPGTANKQAEEVINKIAAPPGFSWEFSGNEKERKESFFILLQAGCLGMMLVYMVMASQFESLLAPFIIFLSVPFGFMGAIIMLALSGTRVSVASLLGFIILIGIVVNKGIVLISYVNTLIGRGYKTKKALIEAGKSRLRPVLSTTMTTVLGMIPMALSKGDGSEMWVPLGWSVIGGLIVSTIITLVLMPVLYSLLQKWLVPEDQRDNRSEEHSDSSVTGFEYAR